MTIDPYPIHDRPDMQMNPESDTLFGHDGDNEAPDLPVRVVIIDDDIAAIKVLENALRIFGPRVEICGTASTLAEGRAIISEEMPDIAFIDIEFPDESETGLDLVGLDRKYGGNMEVVFYTSYNKYLINALRLQAFDFLLKPVDTEELRIIMRRYMMERGRAPQTAIYTPGLLGAARDRSDARALAITTVTNDRIIVSPSSIIFFKYDSDRKVWEVVMSNLQRHILKRHTTADVILNYGPDFIRTHQIYIVNVAYLGMITNNSCTLLPPYNDITEIKISKSFRRQLLDRFYDL
ncbi:MAG: LytTR family DNA-binding domain-containing protein [Muribaculaceae bacterium]|nr:LytTR family DNA-binding domain-containing protein [Muribaculaceae bacterium]